MPHTLAAKARSTSAWYSGSGGGSNYELAAGDLAGAGGGMMILHIYNVFILVRPMCVLV